MNIVIMYGSQTLPNILLQYISKMRLLQCVAVCCSVLQPVAVCCSVLQCVTVM